MENTGTRATRKGMIAASVPLAMLMALVAGTAMAARSASKETPKAAIARKVDEYIRSIDRADIGLGAAIWATTPNVSFIHPRGHERGWAEIARNFYGKTMGESFTKRELKRVGELDIQVYGNSAVVTFNWNFVATRADNGEQLHTEGRETQVYENLPRKGWRIVHVHYSGPPRTGAGQGF